MMAAKASKVCIGVGRTLFVANATFSVAIVWATVSMARGAVLDVGFDEDIVVNVADGARLRLDFPGTLKLDGLKYAGRSYSGTLTAERCPFLLGPGSLEVTPKGTVLFFR